MRQSQQARRRNKNSQSRARRATVACIIDSLESRQLFSGETLSNSIPAILAHTSTPSVDSITLNRFFTDSTIPGTLVTFTTSLGKITVALTDAATPLTVANFLNYINSGAYTNTIFHRDAILSAAGGTAGPKTPADIIQGGGFVVDGSKFNHIPTNTPLNDEFTSRVLNNSAGTLAMAKTPAANSATSEWYFNVHDESTALDPPTTSGSVQTSYTVFGKVVTGLNVVNAIAGLPTYNASSANSALGTLPVLGLTAGQIKKNHPISSGNLVYTKSITSTPGTNFTVTSDNNSLVTPKITNGVLSFTYASGLSGTANITIVAKNLDGTSATTSFPVTVPNSATPTAGPTAGNVTAPNSIAGTTANINVLANSTDSVAALNTSSVAIVTQPVHGSATVNASTGQISYTPTAGFTGADSLTFTVGDTAGTVSAAATVSLNVVAAPVTVTIGTAKARSLTFTRPGGAVGHLFVTGGTAVVTFAGSTVSTSTTGGVVSASGADATIASIVITNTGAAASLRATGAVTLGAITDNKDVSVINAPNATLTGSSSFKSINRLIAAAATNSTLSLGSGNSTVLMIPNVTNTSVTSTGAIASITSNQWVNTDGGFYGLSTSSIGRLKIAGPFANVLNLSSTGNSLGVAKVGLASSAWTIGGAVGSATFATPASTWSLTASGRIGSVTVNGNLASNVSGSTIGSFIVTGTSTGATIKTTAASSKAVQITRLKFGGAVTNSTISSSGDIASITAASLTSTQFKAGLLGSLIVAGATTSASINTTQTLTGNIVQIGRLKFGGAVATSSFATSGNVGSVTAASFSSTQIVAGTIASLVVGGTTTGTSITTDGGLTAGKLQIGRLSFGGDVGTSSINAVGNIGSVTAASLTASHIYAGVTNSIVQAAGLPTALTNFTGNARIDSVTLGKAANAFSNSLISAETIGNLHLGNINTANSGAVEGVGVHKITSITGALVPGGALNAGPSQLRSATTIAGYVASKKLALGDFAIKII